MSRPRKLTPVQRLMHAMDACAHARGEASWTNGYRAGNVARADADGELYDRELRQWHACERAEKTFRRLVQRVLREARS